MTGLEQRLHSAFPHLSFRTRGILDALLLDGGVMGNASRVAELVGTSSRFALARLLRRDGLPPLHDLSAWISVLTWVTTAERTHASLFSIASRSGRSPATCYRLVKRVTGLTWSAVLTRGSLWTLRMFLKHNGAATAAAVRLPATQGTLRLWRQEMASPVGGRGNLVATQWRGNM